MTKAESDRTQEARRLWAVTKMGVFGLYQTQIPRMAAALAYRTIFSIIPVMAIGLLIFGSVVSESQVESGVRRVLTFAGISQISTSEGPTSEEPTGEEPVGEPEVSQIEEGLDLAGDPQGFTTELESGADSELDQRGIFADADLEQVIADLINRVNSSIRNVPTGWIALTSGLVLLYAAMSMLIEIEKSFNQLCGAPSGRGWLRRLMLYWTILTAGSLMLAATFLAGDAFARLVVSFAGEESMVGAVMAGYGVSVLISTVLLLGAYLIIPNTKVQFRSALAGAFFAAVLWELGKLGFTIYLDQMTGYAKLYGSIAILPLFMLWVYLTWLIVLLGMQASFTLQNFSRLVESKLRLLSDPSSLGTALIDPLVILAIAKAVQGCFVEGKPCSVEMVASKARIESSQANKLLDALTNAGITHRVYEGESLVGWAPARPADRIGLDEILQVAHRVDGFRISGADDGVPVAIKEAASGVCKGMTLADLSDSVDKSASD